MSTHANIFVRVEDSDIGTTKRFNPNLLPENFATGAYDKNNCPFEAKWLTKKITLKKYCFIFLHWDGYPNHSGIGSKLLKHFNTYETALNLTLAGDLSSLGGYNPQNDIRYLIPTWPDVSAEVNEDGTILPGNVNTRNAINGIFDAPYIYLFEKGQWKVKPLTKVREGQSPFPGYGRWNNLERYISILDKDETKNGVRA